MSTLEMLLVVIFFLLLGWVGLTLALQTYEYVTKKTVSLRTLFIGLKPKLVMTAGLGLFFLTSYVGVIFLAPLLIDVEARLMLFVLALKHPIYFVYAGLIFFIIISLGILVLRNMIKRLYNRR